MSLKNNQTETVEDFMDDHANKLRPDYDPYSYVDELYNFEPEHEIIEDFEWQNYDGSICEF